MKKNKIIGVLIAALSLISINSVAKSNTWLEQHEQGWHWYQDPNKIIKKPIDPAKPSTKSPTLDPLEEVNLYKENLARLHAEAIMRPTLDNVHAYLKAQVAATERASYFSVVWNEVLRRHPDLDYNVKFPAAQYARHIYLDQEKDQLDQLMKQFSQKYGLMMFIKHNCRFCHAMVPIVARVAEEYGIHVTYVSLDGRFIDNLPNQVKDNGIATKMQITQVPAVIAVEPKRDQWFPIVVGAVSEIELKEHIQAHIEYLANKDQPQTVAARLNPGDPNVQTDVVN